MAQKKQVALRKAELTAQLADSRRAISRGREALRRKLQVKKQWRKLLTGNPRAVFAGSIGAGLFATLLLRRPRKPATPPKTSRQMLLGWLLALLKPAAKAWLVTRAKRLASERGASRIQQEKNLEVL